MKEYEIWSEGYAATGESAPAHLHGKQEAESFFEACLIFFKGSYLFNVDRMTYWGCRLFDNETDARKSFG